MNLSRMCWPALLYICLKIPLIFISTIYLFRGFVSTKANASVYIAGVITLIISIIVTFLFLKILNVLCETGYKSLAWLMWIGLPAIEWGGFVLSLTYIIGFSSESVFSNYQ